MIIFCFGAFAEILLICSNGYIKGQKRRRNKTVPQHVLVGVLLNAIDSSKHKDWADSDNAGQLARKLLRCEQHIPDELKVVAESVEASSVAPYFTERLLPLLEKPEVAILAIKDMIKNDDRIRDAIVAKYFGKKTKEEFLSVSPINPVDFLANVFVYAIRTDNKNGKAKISEVTEDYVLSFEQRVKDFAWDTSTMLTVFKGIKMERLPRTTFDLVANYIYPPSVEDWELFIEVDGECPECSKVLFEGKKGRSVPRYMVTVIDASEPATDMLNKIALCPECHDKYILDTSSEEIKQMTSRKMGFVNLMRSRNALAENKVPIEIQIEEVLEAIEMTPLSSLNRIGDERVYEVEQKVTESVVLMKKIRENALDYFETVEALLKASDQSRSTKFRLFQAKVIACYEEAKANEASQERVYYHLVEWLYKQAKNKHRSACEIVIAFFVQICDVFEKTDKADEHAIAK